jgi:hypothetical protein
MNVDKTGCSDFCTSREVKVLVPSEYEEDAISVSVGRNSKRSTMTACIAADGFRMKPFTIVDRTTAEKIEYSGYDRTNVILVSQEYAFMTKTLFDLWGDEVFFLPSRSEELNSDMMGGSSSF